MPPSSACRRRLLQAAGLALLPLPAFADDFPNHPIRMVTPYPPGASTDALARAVASGMVKALGQTVIVDNRAGAGGNVAAAEVRKSAPDGYTLLLVSAGILTMNQSLYKRLPYDPVKDFAPLTIAVKMPLLVICNPARPYRTLKELIEYARAHPGKVSYGSAGNGTSQHMAGELFKTMAGVDLLHVPYKGGAPAMTDLLGGQIDAMFVQAPSGLPQVKAGKVRALAVGSPKRIEALPELPTVAESGVPGYDSDTWYGFVMPDNVPKERGDKLYGAIRDALQEARPRLEEEGFIVDAGTPQAMRQTVRTEAVKWAKVIREANIQLE